MTRRIKVTQFGTERAAVYAKELAPAIREMYDLYQQAVGVVRTWLSDDTLDPSVSRFLNDQLREYVNAKQVLAAVGNELNAARSARDGAILLQVLRQERLEYFGVIQGTLTGAYTRLDKLRQALPPVAKPLEALAKQEQALNAKTRRLMGQLRTVAGERGYAAPWNKLLRPLYRDFRRMDDMLAALSVPQHILWGMSVVAGSLELAAQTRSQSVLNNALATAAKDLQRTIEKFHAVVGQNPKDTDLLLAERRFRAFQTRFLLIKKQLLGA